ncbi:uncharacterized protein LOC120339464 [Styela clava]
MWKEAFDGEPVTGMSATYYAEDGDSYGSRRVSAASDDSFDASSYVHVDSKLSLKMPKCILNDENVEPNVNNHFTNCTDNNANHDVTKSGKKIIRKRLSVSQFNASRLKNLNNNNSKNNNDLSSSSSSDSDTLPKPEKKNKDVLSAKIQHLLFGMKQLRQLDRDILRKFLVINDRIEEQRWMVEEKQEAIKRSLSEEGQDPVTVNFDLVPEIVPEEQEDDEESIQSVLSRQNSSCEVFDNDDTLPADDTPVNQEPPIVASKKCLDSDLVSTSSDSALSMSGASSTLSSTTSLPVSNRSSSPPSSNISNASTGSSSLDKASQKSERTTTLRQTDCNHPATLRQTDYSIEEDFAGDIEGYYRMHGSSMKRGSYPFPRQTQSFNAGVYQNSTKHYDDGMIHNSSGYSTRRGSNGSDSRDAAEYALAVRKSIINRSYSGPFRSSSDAYQKPRPRSASSNLEPQDIRNRAKRISVRPDGTHDALPSVPNRRPYSANDKKSAAYRLLQHPSHKRHIARMNVGNQLQNLAFVPIAEQEPDIMYENGRLYSNDSDAGTKFEIERRDYQNLIDVSRQRQPLRSTRQCPPVVRKPSAAGSAGSLTSSSSRTSSSSLTSSSSSSSLHSPTKFVMNEADSYSRPVQEPVWVQRRRHTVQSNEYIAIPHSKAFPASYAPKYSNQGAHNLPEPTQTRPVPKIRSKSYHTKTETDRVLTVSYKPTNKGSNQAVYNWIQTQDDVTYL